MGEILEPIYDRIKKDDYCGQYDIIEKISFADGQIHIREFPETGMDLYLADKGDLITSKINLHQGAVALSPRRLSCSTHYQIYRPNSTDCKSDFLFYVLRSPQFLAQLMEQKNKGIKNEQGADFILGFEIPLPSLEHQTSIISRLKSFVDTIDGCKAVEKQFCLHIPEVDSVECFRIGEAVIETRNGWSPPCNGGQVPVLSLACLKRGYIDLDERKYTSETRKDIESFYVHEGDFFYSRGNTPELVALAGIAGIVSEQIVFPDLLTRVTFDRKKILPEYAVILFNSDFGRNYFRNVPQGASPSMVKVSQKYMEDFQIPFLGNIEIQHEIVQEAQELRESLFAIEKIKNYSVMSPNS